MTRINKLKIAVYSGEIPSTTFIERLIDGLSEKGHTILLFGLISCNKVYRDNILVKGYKNSKFSKLITLIKYSILLKLFKPKEKRKLDNILKINFKSTLYNRVKYYPVVWYEPDIFHLQWAKGIEEWFWVKDFGIKLVVSLRGAHINYSPIANKTLAETYQLLFPKVDRFHAVSKAIAKEAKKYGADTNKIDVVYSGLEIPRILKTKSKISSKIRLLSVGRSHWKKGYQYAIDACSILKTQGLEFCYTILGLTESIELKYQIEDLGLSGHVNLIGQQPFIEVERYIEDADVLILPSVEEGIANVVLEAMVRGTIVISTYCGGMSEVITNSENGFLVELRNPQAIVDAICQLMELNKEEQDTMAQNALIKINEQHRKNLMIEGMELLYNKALN